MTEATAKLRRADLLTGLGLAAFAVAMLAITATFPMTDSYGGVQNVWYVSPALFPGLVALGILVFAGLLVRRAVRDLGSDGVRRALSFAGAAPTPRTLRLVLILGAVIAYVYVFVPRVDFLVATTFFLAVFIFAFHLDREASVARNLYLLLAVTALVVLAALALPETLRDPVVDAGTALGVVAAAWWNARALARQDLPLTTWRTGLLVALLTPIIVCPLFKYGLLVPLPHEGTVISAMDSLRYALFR